MLPDNRDHVCLAQGLSPAADPVPATQWVFNIFVQRNQCVDLGPMQRAGQKSDPKIFLMLFIVSLL